MKRKSIPNLLLATALVLLLPLEQVMCACMGFAAQPTPVASVAGHECCDAISASGSEHHSRPEQAPHACSCNRLVESAVPVVIEGGLQAPELASVAVLTGTASFTPLPVCEKTTSAPDSGSPSIPEDPGAHGLRAPPVSA